MNSSLFSNHEFNGKTNVSPSPRQNLFYIKNEEVLSHLQHWPFPSDIMTFVQQYNPLFIQNYQELQQNVDFQIESTNGGLFFGIIQNNRKCGLGIQYRQKKSIYEGDWENNLKHGRGLEMFLSGSFYEGQYVKGKPEGIGRFFWNNGETYEGEWKEGMKDGTGIWKGSKGDSYIGEWKMGGAEGYGVHIWINGDRYEGQFKNCLKEGHGTEKFANGDTYIGNYHGGKPSGQGQYYWHNGAVYKGEFINGLRHGKGIWKRGNNLADCYEGDYNEDLKNGYGIFNWADGNRYEGEFKNDVRWGFGIMHWSDGSYYKGQWKGGIQDGEGLLVSNQEAIQGIFYGTKIIQVFEQSSSRHCESRQFNFSENINTELKYRTEQSTKIDSFTQTNLQFRLTTNSVPRKKDIKSRLLSNLHKQRAESHSPRLNDVKKLYCSPKKYWMPTGVVIQKRHHK